MGRSIIAEAITRKYMGRGFKAMSGGSEPRDDIHPVAHRVLKNNHCSSVNLVSKSWDIFSEWEPDIVITLCDKVLKQKCPAYVGGAVHVHWGLPDPNAQFGNMEENFTRIFHILDERIKKMLEANIETMDKTELRAHLKEIAK